MAEQQPQQLYQSGRPRARIYAPMVPLRRWRLCRWWPNDGDLRHALNVAVACLITPVLRVGLAVLRGQPRIARLFDMGFLVKSGTALERLQTVDGPRVRQNRTLTRPRGNAAALAELSVQQSAIAGAFGQASAHPVAQGILAALPVITRCWLADVTEVAGPGMQGTSRRETVRSLDVAMAWGLRSPAPGCAREAHGVRWP